MASSEEDRRAQCAEDQREAYRLIVQIPLLVSKFQKLENDFESMSGRMDGLDQFKKDFYELKDGFDEFKGHLEENVIIPFTDTVKTYNTIKSRAPWVILFIVMTGADWDNIPKVLSAIVNTMKLAGV